MFQSIGQRKANIALRRLPSIRASITVVWIADPCTLSQLFDEKMNRPDPTYSHYIVWYSSILKSIKYFKQARSYERIIVVVLVDDSSSINNEALIKLTDIIHLGQYPQIRSILVVSSNTDFSLNIGDNTKKTVEIFVNYKSMFIRLQQLMKEVEESDDDLFTIFRQRDKSLRDVRQELGPFVWSHSYKGQSVYSFK